MNGEGTDDRLSRIEEQLDRIEGMMGSMANERRDQDPDGDREPLDVEQAQDRLDKLGERIEETRRNALGREATAEPAAESQDPTPEGDVEQAEDVVGDGPPAPG